MILLPEETINDPKALHNVFVEMQQAYTHQKVPMNHYQSEMLIKIMLATNDQIDGIFDSVSKTFPIGGFISRMGILPIKFEKRLLVSLGVIHSEEGIGGLILIGYYLQWAASLAGKTFITTDWVYSDIWPFGIFNSETIHEFWDKQKVKARPDNLVDHATAGYSFLKPHTEPIV